MELLTVLTLVFGCKTRLNNHFENLHPIHIRRHQGRSPVHSIVMKSIEEEEIKIPRLGKAGVGIFKFPMGSTNHTVIHLSFRDRQALSNLHDIQFPRRRPSNRVEILSQRPKGRPQTFFNVRHPDRRFYPAVLEQNVVFRLDTTRRPTESLFAGGNLQHTIVDGNVVGCVKPKFLIPPSVIAWAISDIVRPIIRVQGCATELVTPKGGLGCDTLMLSYKSRNTQEEEVRFGYSIFFK
mmetsp:Transcript_69396/g.104670  ORF Transcript_69396/g.104670 Transcript_69396/m.104670 type:complete len:237 (-) Transcript_69396:22-732(-)